MLPGYLVAILLLQILVNISIWNVLRNPLNAAWLFSSNTTSSNTS